MSVVYRIELDRSQSWHLTQLQVPGDTEGGGNREEAENNRERTCKESHALIIVEVCKRRLSACL